MIRKKNTSLCISLYLTNISIFVSIDWGKGELRRSVRSIMPILSRYHHISHDGDPKHINCGRLFRGALYRTLTPHVSLMSPHFTVFIIYFFEVSYSYSAMFNFIGKLFLIIIITFEKSN